MEPHNIYSHKMAINTHYIHAEADLDKISSVCTEYICSGYPRAHHGWARGEKFLILQDVRLQETAFSAPLKSINNDRVSAKYFFQIPRFSRFFLTLLPVFQGFYP